MPTDREQVATIMVMAAGGALLLREDVPMPFEGDRWVAGAMVGGRITRLLTTYLKVTR
jgi:hypothetical protein